VRQYQVWGKQSCLCELFTAFHHIHNLTFISTGATGYIGGSVLNKIIETYPQVEISALLRAPSDEFVSRYPKVAIVKGTFDDSDIIANAAQNADIVIRKHETPDVQDNTEEMQTLETLTTQVVPKQFSQDCLEKRKSASSSISREQGASRTSESKAGKENIILAYGTTLKTLMRFTICQTAQNITRLIDGFRTLAMKP
jgi:nucleoside-diphosphate-sugar epimerase